MGTALSKLLEIVTTDSIKRTVNNFTQKQKYSGWGIAEKERQGSCHITSG